MATIEDPTTFTKAVTLESGFVLGGDQTIGDGTDAATLNLDKDGATAGSVIFKIDGVKRASLVSSSAEDLTLSVFASNGTTVQGSISIAQADGMTTVSNGVTVTAGGVTVSAGNLAVSAGSVTASTTVQGADLVATDDLTVGNDATITAGNLLLSAGNATLTSGNIVVTSGNLTLSSGNLLMSSGTLTITGITVVGLETYLTVYIASLVATKVYGINSPVAGTITRIASTLNVAALTTGDATITGAIAATPITTGAITITQSGSAVGDLDAVTPSAANVVAIGDWLNFTVAGTNDAATASATLTITVRRSA
jgi:hypothetical protein